MKVCVIANSRERQDITARQWYQREVDTFAALGAEALLSAAWKPFPLPDLYVSWWAARSAPAVAWSRLTGRRCIVVAGGTDSIRDCPAQSGHPFFYSGKPWWVKLLTRCSLRWADAVVAVSDSTRPDLAELGARQIWLVPNCIDTALFRPAGGGGWGEVVTVCNLESGACSLKRLPVVLEAFRIARTEFRDIRLTIAGTLGGGFEEMRETAGKLGILEAVRFTGRLSNPEMARLFQASSVFLTATGYETFGVAVAEAMACGLAVVAPDLPALREVAGPAAALVAGSRAEDFAAALVRVLADAAYRRRLGAAARERICSRYDQRARIDAMRKLLLGLGLADEA